MKKIFTLFVAAVAAVTMSAKTAESGYCGANLTWFYNPSDSSLTITGTGPMTNYSQDNYAPWYEYQDKITSLKLESGMTTIGDYAFYWLVKVKDVDIPDGVTSIGDYAFSGCAALDWLYIPYGVKTIGQSAFAACISLEGVYMRYGLTSIGVGAFGFCTELVEVAIPATVTTIGDKAFYYCSKLSAIANFATNPQSINADVFDGVDKTKCSLYVPDYAEANYNKPTWIEFSKETFESSGDYEGTSLHYSYDFETGTMTITGTGMLPDSETHFPFVYDVKKQINKLVLPSGLTGIGTYNFAYFSALTFLKIPYGVAILKESAFEECYALETVEIPSSTAIIDDYVFYYCYSLKTVYNLATVPQSINATVFYGVDISKCTLFVPKGCKAAYEAAPVWKDFIIKEMAAPEGIDEVGIQPSAVSGQKVLREGVLYLKYEGRMYDVQGREVPEAR